MSEPLQTVKLSKGVFMTLKEGLFVASNCCDLKCKPVFADKVWPLGIRDLQWQIIRECRANNLLCRVYQTRADFHEDYLKMLSTTGGK